MKFLGTFAIVCLMTGKAVLEHSHPSYFANQNSLNTTSIPSLYEGNNYSPVEVATVVTFTVALFQVKDKSLYNYNNNRHNRKLHNIKLGYAK